MLYLSELEKVQWREICQEVLSSPKGQWDFEGEIRKNLLPAFRYYIGTTLVSGGQGKRGAEWLKAGALSEEEGLFSNAFLIGFLERQGGRLAMPAVVFADPRPFVHWAGVPIMKNARAAFVTQCGHSLPRFAKPLRIMDIGCGDGALLVNLLQNLLEIGKVSEIGEILLVDASPGMIDLARRTVGAAFPSSAIRTATHRIQEISGTLDSRYDVAVASLAYHHMPIEDKRIHLEHLRRWVDHFMLFELDANNDAPELHSPELALSIYQSYGRLIDFIFAHDASVEVAISSVDNFLMSEEVSFLTQPRGKRTDYHMLRTQWVEFFRNGLGPDYSCWCDSTCYADEYIDLFTLHFGRS